MLAGIKITDIIDKYSPTVLEFAIRVLIAIVILIVGRLIIKLIIKIIDKLLVKARVEISVNKFLKSLIRVGLYIVLIIFIGDQLGVPTTSFVAVLGSAGIAIGLALQGSLSNFAGGVLILMLKPFKVGDYIFEGASSREGKVEKIDLFYTTLVSPDNKKITVPNGKLSNSDITNYSYFETRRLDLDFNISYSTDTNLAKDLTYTLIKATKGILQDEEISVYVKVLAENFVTMGIIVWVKTEDYQNVKNEINEAIKQIFGKSDIQLPYKKVEVQITNK